MSFDQKVRTLVLLYGVPRLSAVLKAWQYSDVQLSGLALAPTLLHTISKAMRQDALPPAS
jgi:hypothetical protein